MRWHAEWFAEWHHEWFGLLPKPDFDGYGPEGVATFVLDFEQGFTVTHEWITDIQRMRAGHERRASRNDISRQRFSGTALLGVGKARAIRATLAQHAALGSPFLLGLPHEAISCTVNGNTVTLPAGSLLLCDWDNIGQRVVVCWYEDGELNGVDAVIQHVGADVFTLNVAPTAGSVIMPTVPVYLEPQQNFPRYRTKLESWQLNARAALFDFAPTLASLALDTYTASAAFNGVVVMSRIFGLAGNDITFELVATGTGTGQLTETTSGAVTFAFEPGVTTLGDLASTLELSTLVKLTGTYNPADTIAAGDAFGPQALSGGTATGDVGAGVAIATYDGDGTERLVWDRKLDIDTTNTDSVHGMTAILDNGGAISVIGNAEHPDYGRALPMTGKAFGADWQWWKQFLHTVKGQQKMFWLPTWREDLVAFGHAGDTIDIDADDFTAWWPAQREHVMIEQEDGTRTYAKILSSVDNGDATRSITINQVLSGWEITRISWLELCRMNSGELEVTFQGGTFSA